MILARLPTLPNNVDGFCLIEKPRGILKFYLVVEQQHSASLKSNNLKESLGTAFALVLYAFTYHVIIIFQGQTCSARQFMVFKTRGGFNRWCFKQVFSRKTCYE